MINREVIYLEDNLHITLTNSQVRNLIEFIELYFIDSIRADTEMDNIDYIVDIVEALKELRKASIEDSRKNLLDKYGIKETNNDN